MKVKIGNHKSCLYQWDTGQFVVIDGAEQCNEIHFCNDRSKNALVVKITDQDGKRIANIPNILLQNDGSIYAYLFAKNEDGAETRTSASFPVRGRKKPENYVYTETEKWTYDNIERRLDDLEDIMANGTVKTVNGRTPDADGNVEVDILVVNAERIIGNTVVSHTASEIKAASNDGKAIFLKAGDKVYPYISFDGSGAKFELQSVGIDTDVNGMKESTLCTITYIVGEDATATMTVTIETLATDSKTVVSVNGVSPDKNGNIEVSAMPDDTEQLDMLIEADMLPAVHYNGAVLTDQNGRIILRY